MIFNKLYGLRQDLKNILIHFTSLLFVYLGLYTALRFFFYIWNYDQLKTLSFLELFYAFIVGIRFDLVLAGPVAALVIIFAFWIRSRFKYLLIMPLLLLQASLMTISLVDSELTNYMGRRFTVNSLYVLGEGGAQSILAYYPLIIFGFFLMLVYFFLSFRLTQSIEIKTKSIATLTLLIIALIFSRGGLQQKPLSFINSKVINHPFAHQLVLNSAFTFVKSIGRNKAERINFFEHDQMLSLLNLNSVSKSTLRTPWTPQNMNLILIMMESMSSEYINEKNTPFFMELSKKGTLFNPAYANGLRSVEGVAAILAGIPALMEESFINSEFANEFIGLGTLFKNKGYHTSFFHGAKNGSMRFDAFTRAAGFDQYFGKNEFNDDSFDDGAWGIFDKPFLNWTCKQISSFPDQFASIIFTLTAHVPFPLPEDFKAEMAKPHFKNEPAIIQSIHYSDQALRDFFKCAATQPWYKNTLFVFVADHTGPSLKPNASLVSKFEVPILFYTENSARLNALHPHQYAQQIDILPTLVDFFGLSLIEKNHMARSLFEKGPKNIVLFADRRYEVVGDNNPSEDTVKAFRQYFSQGLYDNRLYFPPGGIK